MGKKTGETALLWALMDKLCPGVVADRKLSHF
jgi:hypothetical protein